MFDSVIDHFFVRVLPHGGVWWICTYFAKSQKRFGLVVLTPTIMRKRTFHFFSSNAHWTSNFHTKHNECCFEYVPSYSAMFFKHYICLKSSLFFRAFYSKVTVKSSFSVKFTKIWKYLHLFWRYWVKTAVLSKQVGDFFKFCGLLIMFKNFT